MATQARDRPEDSHVQASSFSGPLGGCGAAAVALRFRRIKEENGSLTFSNTQTVDVLSFQTRSAKVGVRGLKKAKITGVNLTLHRLSHELPGPVSFLLVAADGSNPNGEWTLHVYNANASDPG